MGILDKSVRNKTPQTELTKEELEFILLKLRKSTYIGDEFEMFYKVWVKLVNKTETIK